jgi:predicted TIM-barrel fold metal-dependent hydrolase
MFAAATIVCGGVLERFPRLRVALLEAGSAWGPYLFDRLDEHYEKRPHEMPLLTKRPSEYLHDGRIVVSCEGERFLPHALAGLGEHTVAFASDYPHWDSEFPNTVRNISDRDDLTDDQKRAVLGGNALRLYPHLLDHRRSGVRD